MSELQVAQAVLDKVTKITPPARMDELIKIFQSAGYQVDAASKKITGGAGSLQKLGSALGSTMPTARICAKRVLAQAGVNI